MPNITKRYIIVKNTDGQEAGLYLSPGDGIPSWWMDLSEATVFGEADLAHFLDIRAQYIESEQAKGRVQKREVTYSKPMDL